MNGALGFLAATAPHAEPLTQARGADLAPARESTAMRVAIFGRAAFSKRVSPAMRWDLRLSKRHCKVPASDAESEPGGAGQNGASVRSSRIEKDNSITHSAGSRRL